MPRKQLLARKVVDIVELVLAKCLWVSNDCHMHRMFSDFEIIVSCNVILRMMWLKVKNICLNKKGVYQICHLVGVQYVCWRNVPKKGSTIQTAFRTLVAELKLSILGGFTSRIASSRCQHESLIKFLVASVYHSSTVISLFIFCSIFDVCAFFHDRSKLSLERYSETNIETW